MHATKCTYMHVFAKLMDEQEGVGAERTYQF